MASLSGKVVIITGASSGFGAAAARLFAQEGCKLVLAARRLDKLEETAKEIRTRGGDALAVPVDVSQPEQIQALVQSTMNAYGSIDVLFNNAGFGRLDWFEVLDPIRDIQAQITVDLLGVMWTARAVLPQMYRQRGGQIINMCSIAGWAAPPLYTVYSAAKFGVRGFTEALRRETAPFGVHVSILYPGSSPTEFQQHVGQNKAKQRFTTPQWLRVTPNDVARGVVSLAKRPRRSLFLPKIMGLSVFVNSHFPGLSDAAQARAFASYHAEDMK
ncbi:MAG TPA: SDR family NAD(P)-dependent oxidoreductase [Anaerolineales bacterium]|nr:SDR family NAD(P)-dependent oxidoreductase [Anaerolineales bacterium]